MSMYSCASSETARTLPATKHVATTHKPVRRANRRLGGMGSFASLPHRGACCADPLAGLACSIPSKEVVMRRLSLCLACAGAVLAAPTVQAVTCDIVLDRNNNVIYQDTTPPVDMSERGVAAREKMRQRGELLMIIESDQCPRLVYSPVTGAASVDAIVAEMRPYVAVTGGMGKSAAGGVYGASGGAAAGAPAAGAAASGSGPGRY